MILKKFTCCKFMPSLYLRCNTVIKPFLRMGETSVDNPPHWGFFPYTPAGDIEGMPDWKEVDFYDYDNNMTAIVFVSTDLGIDVTERDRMAAIINGEVREVCKPVLYKIPDTEKPLWCFMLYIPYMSGDGDVELQYYNALRNQTYVEKNQFNVNDDTVGDDDVFVFTLRPMACRNFAVHTYS